MALLPWNTQRESGAEHFQAVSALTHIHQLVANELTRVLRPHGLTQTAFQLMATLLISPEQRRPLGQLSRALLVHKTTVALAIEQLQERGLVIRQPHPTDRRTVLATLTEEGRKLVTRAGNDLAATRFGLDGVTDPVARQLTDVLDQVSQQMYHRAELPFASAR